MNDKIYSLGEDYKEWPKKYWGTRDRALDDALKAQSERLHSSGPIVPTEPITGLPGGLYGPDKSAERRRRAADRCFRMLAFGRWPWC